MRLYGLYAITPPNSDDDALLAQVAAAVDGGARILQYRCKNPAERGRQAALLAEYCRRQAVCFIINDDVKLARECDADGVHLGRHDMPIEQARKRLGGAKIIGGSCYDSIASAEAAAEAGADYIALGAVFSSATKPATTPCPLSRLAEVKQRVTLPVVAVGGITPANAAAAINAGADAVAVSRGLFAADNIRAAAAALSRLFDDNA